MELPSAKPAQTDREAGGIYEGLARLLGVEGDYRKLVDFLRNNELRPGGRSDAA